MPDFTDRLKPAEPSGPSILFNERNGSDVPVQELAKHLLSRNNFLERQARILPILEKDPLFKKTKQSNLSRPERYHLGLARAKKLRRLADKYGWDHEDQDMASYLCDDVSPYMVHASMFITTVREQGDEEQRKKWLPRIRDWEVIGCYAQTELGHGSNVRGIECQARWDPKTKEFVIHSPTLTASKWWNGTMGRTANHAIVVAQLLVPKSTDSNELVNHGPHPFIVQIRDMKTHQNLPGIAVGDIGPKYGYASMDNGYMLFDNVRVPHSAMLSNYSRVDPNTCTYSKPANPAVVYGSLTAVRAAIVMHARLVLARAVTIAVRYTSIRRQFSDRDSNSKSAPELSVLDYPTVQIRILPLLATAFALHYTGSAMQTLYQRTRADISKGDFSKLAELHSQSSGLKSLCTDYAANGIETCRRALGGHGFGGGSGLIQLNADYLSKPTVEGDNWMITQQTASYLVKRMAAAEAKKGEPQDEVERSCREYIAGKDRFASTDFNVLDNDNHIILAFQCRSRHLSYLAHIARNKDKQSWNSLLLQLRKVSNAESESLLVANFHAALSSQDSNLSPKLKEHLRPLFRLFAFYIMDNNARDFAKARAVSEDDLDRLPSLIQDLMSHIRPHAVNLVDAWSIPDFLLDSALGRSDGKVYEDLFDRAHRQNPLNELTFNSDYRSEEISSILGNIFQRIVRYFRGEELQPPRPLLLVIVEVSDPILSKFGARPFRLTLHVTVDSNAPITTYTPKTLLNSKGKALYSGGLVFTDRNAAEAARRNTIDICSFDNRKTSVSHSSGHIFTEIRTHSSGNTYSVTHEFNMPPFGPDEKQDSGPEQIFERMATTSGQAPVAPESSYQEEFAMMMSDTSGLEVGSMYDVTLGQSMSKIRWWKPGRKSDVLARGGRLETFVEDEHPAALEMTQTSSANFSVVA